MENTKQTDAVDERYPDTPIGIVRSRDAFLRDLPALLANPKYDRWSVVYCGDKRIAMAKSLADVTRVCRELRLQEDEIYIGCVFPHGEDDEEVEFGFHEFEDIYDVNADSTPKAPDPIP